MHAHKQHSRAWRGPEVGSCTTCFSQVRPGDSSAATSEQPFLINCDKWANHNQTTACESWFVTCFLRCSRLRRGLFIRTASSRSCVWDGGIRQHVDPEWNIQSILVVAPTPPPFFWRKHLKSAKYGHFPESSQPMTCTPFPERETREREKNKKDQEGGVPAARLIRPPFRGLCSVCIHDLCKVATSFPLNLAGGSHFKQHNLKLGESHHCWQKEKQQVPLYEWVPTHLRGRPAHLDQVHTPKKTKHWGLGNTLSKNHWTQISQGLMWAKG